VQADGREEIWIRRSQNTGHGCSSRDADDIDAVGINGPALSLLYDVLDNCGYTGWFSTITRLI
jgi:hypothetical protein